MKSFLNAVKVKITNQYTSSDKQVLGEISESLQKKKEANKTTQNKNAQTT